MLGVIVSIAALYTIFEALILSAAALSPEGGRLQKYLDKEIQKTGGLRKTITGLVAFLQNLPKNAIRSVKVIAIMVLVLVGMVACTAVVFSAGSAVSSWPSWAVIIVILLVVIAMK